MPIDQDKSKLWKVSLFLAREGDPYGDLGFSTQQEAHEYIGRLFDVPAQSVKLERDAFDNYTKSARKGWDRPLRPALKTVWETYGHLEYDEFLLEIRKIVEPQEVTAMNNLLSDLPALAQRCRDEINLLDENVEVYLTAEEVDQFVASYRAKNKKHVITPIHFAFKITPSKNPYTLAFADLPKLALLGKFATALEGFREIIDQISDRMGFSSRMSGKEFWGMLPRENWRSSPDIKQEWKDSFDRATNALLTDPTDLQKLEKFIGDPDWSSIRDDIAAGRKLDRQKDWQDSAFQKVGGLIAASSSNLGAVIRALADSGVGDKIVSKIQHTTTWATGGENIIYYGAPGTGKSHTINARLGSNNYVRTVFHPDLQHSDFFGALKPTVEKGELTYSFSPGPFMTAISEAYKNPSAPYYLVIEEINRAEAAAVFGDLFLLLDRDADGTGTYETSFPTDEAQAWIEQNTKASISKLRLPPNLHILATMNSADQGVYPLDTAFRRRWKQQYLPLDDYRVSPTGNITIVDNDDDPVDLPWKTFSQNLNSYLMNLDELLIQEDRLFGPWFVKAEELNTGSVPEKILIYLWDDLLRHAGRAEVFLQSEIKTYGDLNKRVHEGKRIFNPRLVDALKGEGTIV